MPAKVSFLQGSTPKPAPREKGEMKMFCVYDNDKPASVEGYPYMHSSWKNHRFETFEEAQKYARNWLGELEILCPNEPNSRVDYSGYGDMIEIREEK